MWNSWLNLDRVCQYDYVQLLTTQCNRDQLKAKRIRIPAKQWANFTTHLIIDLFQQFSKYRRLTCSRASHCDTASTIPLLWTLCWVLIKYLNNIYLWFVVKIMSYHSHTNILNCFENTFWLSDFEVRMLGNGFCFFSGMIWLTFIKKIFVKYLYILQ